ncbi:phosphoglucosamine mutase [Natronosalvus halobius]|uniref:phosphoglucosamine mutase n=1 Tax=Natronosalvus halobius TaxID=2953746 RepID=UPI00209C8C15|nr:phosphoglucosamine mutase [Natronosalvus halobius]USZ71494.1 phosphoglucosamine mutase [Natronosalvus halobius]
MTFGRMGARGIANKEISPEFIMRISKATAAYLDTNHIAVGRDTRLTGEMLADAAVVGLRSSGVNVTRLGVVPTPSIQRFAEVNTTPALQITASHNPPEYNGIKLIGPRGMVLERNSVKAVREMMGSDELSVPEWNEIGQVYRVKDANTEYIESVISEIDSSVIENQRPLVVLDAGHGAGALTSPTLLQMLGCKVITLNTHPDGNFPGRNPEPTEEGLSDLIRTVPAIGADLGIAHDGDADRVIFVDENGDFIEGDTALAALADAELSPGDTVVTAFNTSQRLADVVRKNDASIEYTPIGNSYILSRVKAIQNEGESVSIAGEGNGGIIYPNHRLNRDGGYVAAKFLQLIAGRSASTVVAPYDGYYLRRKNIPYDTTADRDKILSRASTWAETADGPVTTMDGYRVDLDDGWILVRPSGTEPFVRVYAEATSVKEASERAERVRTIIATT